MAEVTFRIVVSLHQDYGGENFLHEILGKISVRNVDDETEKAAGEIRACLVQFGEAQVHGISARVLGDGYSLEINRYWQELFDLDEFTAEIQSDWQTEGSDLLIVNSIQILEEFEGRGIRLAALGRIVDLFSRSCDLVACFPEQMQDYSDCTVDASEEKTAQTERLDMAKAVGMLQDDCLKAGFRPWGETGIYLLNPTQEHPDVLLE